MSTPLERFHKLRLKQASHCEDCEKSIKSFLLSELSLKEKETIERVREEIKKVYQSAKEDHICSLNDGEQNCECYYTALNDALSTLTNEKR